jgi:hypothetical protein
VQRPAGVVVEAAPVAVGVPAVADVPPLEAVEAGRDLGRFVRATGGGEELLHHHRKQHPVALPGALAGEAGEPGQHPLAVAGVEPVEEPGPGLVQREGDRGGLHELLGAVGGGRPGIRVARVGAVDEALRVALQERGRDLSPGAGDPERGQQERPREPLQAVADHTGDAGAAGQAVLREAGHRVGHHRVEQVVGECLPVRAGPPCVGRQHAVDRREPQRS